MISTKGRYALRVLLDLAEHKDSVKPVPLKDVAERQEISKKYLEIIVKELVNGGYVSGVSDRILTICTIIPAVTYTLIWLLYKFAYPLTKEKLEPIYEEVRVANETLAQAQAEE